jgi:hypothetical protein
VQVVVGHEHALATAHNHGLRRAQLAFGATWTGEWAFTVAIGVVACRDGGATAVGVVAFGKDALTAVGGPRRGMFVGVEHSQRHLHRRAVSITRHQPSTNMRSVGPD